MMGLLMRYTTVAMMCVASLAAATEPASWIAASDKIAREVMAASASYDPETASYYGLSEFDQQTLRLDDDYFARAQQSRHKVLAMLQQRLANADDDKLKQDLAIMVQSLQNEINSAELEREYLLPYFDVAGFVFESFNSLLDPRNDPERHQAALVKLHKYSGGEAGDQPLAEQARARSSERFDLGLLGPYRKQMQSDIDNSEHYIAGIEELFKGSGLKSWEADFQRLSKQLRDYRAWVQATMLPRARSSNQLPLALYQDKLRNYGVDASPEQLIAEGQYSYQFIRGEMKSLARQIAQQRGWKDRDLLSVLKALKSEQIPQDKILSVYQQRLAEVEKIIVEQDIVTLPSRAAVIRLATEAESAASPASFMSPPQLIDNTGQYGEFVLVQRNPTLGKDAQMDDWSHDAMTWPLVVHEARPGHELQFSSLVENGVSLARSLYAFNSANVEGWGLYAESLMQEYLPLEGQLFSLYTRLMRAARMFLDPMVNTGQITPDQARDFLVEETALSLPMASSEADRYSFRAPGQATSYYFGYTALLRLRTELELRMGEKFEQKPFHDFVLAQGLLPPDLLREAAIAHFVAKPSASSQ